MPWGWSGSLKTRQAGCWASQTGRCPQGEPWWRLGFPALGVGLSSCFLLIELLDNASVTRLPASWMNNSRFVQGQLGSSGCTRHLLPGSQLGRSQWYLEWFSCLVLVPQRPVLVGFISSCCILFSLSMS